MVINGLEQDFQFTQSRHAHLIIDSLHDRQSGFEFATNPAGAKYDTQFANDGTWQLGLGRRVGCQDQPNSEGWVAGVHDSVQDAAIFRLALAGMGHQHDRRILRVNEVGSWAPIPTRYTTDRVSMAGTLTGLQGIRRGGTWESSRSSPAG
jgi:hypothetical protein